MYGTLQLPAMVRRGLRTLSRTSKMPWEKSRLSYSREENRSRHTVLFSVEPCLRPSTCLLPWSSNAKRGDHGEGRDLDAVGQQAHDVEIREVFGHQLSERDLGAGDETTGHRGSRRPTGIEAVAYRLEARRIATRREAPIIRSNAISDSSSSPENAFQLGSATSSPASERTRGLSTAIRLPPSTTDDCSYY